MDESARYLQVLCRVTVDGAWMTQWDGNVGLTPQLLGALEYAKHQAVGEMDREASKPVKAATKKMKRAEALNFYIDLRTKMEQRLSAINDSDDQAEFEVPIGEI